MKAVMFAHQQKKVIVKIKFLKKTANLVIHRIKKSRSFGHMLISQNLLAITFDLTEWKSGVKYMPSKQSSTIVYFLLFLIQEILLKMVTKTLRYTNQFFQAKDVSPGSRASTWEKLKFSVII